MNCWTKRDVQYIGEGGFHVFGYNDPDNIEDCIDLSDLYDRGGLKQALAYHIKALEAVHEYISNLEDDDRVFVDAGEFSEIDEDEAASWDKADMDYHTNKDQEVADMYEFGELK